MRTSLLFVLALSARLCAAAYPNAAEMAARHARHIKTYQNIGIDPAEIDDDDDDHFLHEMMFGEAGKPSHQFSISDYIQYIRSEIEDAAAAENDPKVQREFAVWHRKKQMRHDERMKKHSFTELFKTFARSSIGFPLLCIGVLGQCVACYFCASWSVQHKAKRYYNDGGEKVAGFKRGAVRSAKVD